MRKINIHQLIDFRNQPIIDEINKNHISITVVRDRYYGLPYWTVDYNSATRIALIFAGKNIDLNAFSHELLHIIEEINGQASSIILPTLVRMSISPSACIFSSQLIIHINNIILHERMLPKYLKAGFPRNRFVYDYYKKPRLRRLNKTHLKLVNNKRIDRLKLSSFLHSFFAYRFHPNKFIKALSKTRIITKYQTFHPDLIKDLEILCNNWASQTIIMNSDFLTKLLVILDDWRTRNNYTI